MADSAVHLVDEVLPDKPIRQWVLMSKVLGIVYRVISTFLNLHYHMLYLDGVYDKQGIFYPVKSPTYLDTEYLDLNTDENEAIQSIIGASVSKHAGCSLHAGVACKAGQGKKWERLCRYITRPAIAERGGRLRIITGKGRQCHC
ncbi:MAG: hypothetical protein ACI9VI_003364 [Candidatus Azotimanducaceae bacterium]|jgi:hypothetical protein